MKILELNFWKDPNEKYLNFRAKYRENIHKFDVGIILVKMWLKFCIEK
jgi:hypothetical protein